MRLTKEIVRQQAEDLKAIRLTNLQGKPDYYAIVIGIETTLTKLAALMPKIETLCVSDDAADAANTLVRDVCTTYRQQFEEGW